MEFRRYQCDIFQLAIECYRNSTEKILFHSIRISLRLPLFYLDQDWSWFNRSFDLRFAQKHQMKPHSFPANLLISGYRRYFLQALELWSITVLHLNSFYTASWILRSLPTRAKPVNLQVSNFHGTVLTLSTFEKRQNYRSAQHIYDHSVCCRSRKLRSSGILRSSLRTRLFRWACSFGFCRITAVWISLGSTLLTGIPESNIPDSLKY